MKKIIVTIVSLVSFSSFASYLESCEFKAKVIGVQGLHKLDGEVETVKPVVVLKITDYKDRGSHNPKACKSKKGTIQVLELDKGYDYEMFKEGEKLELDYFFSSSWSPSGAMSHTSWELN